MKYKLQHELQAKLDRRIPRGPRAAHKTNSGRVVWFFASQHRFTFEESLKLALQAVQQREPGFIPKLGA